MPRPTLERPNYRLVAIAGRRNWYIAWTENGRTRPVSTQVPLDPQGADGRREPGPEARAALNSFIAAAEAPDDAPTIDWLLAKRLAAWKAVRPRAKPAIASMTSLHGKLSGHFGQMTAAEILPQTIVDYHGHRERTSGRRDGAKPISAITHELEELRTTLLYGKRNRWIADVPEIAFPDPLPPRDRYMTPEQGAALIAGAKTFHVRLFILIALSTGRRRGAILELTWDRVDLARGILDFRNPTEQESNKRRGVCAVDRRLVVALQQARKLSRRKKCPYVITWRGDRVMNIKKGFAEAAIAAGLTTTRREGKARVKVPTVSPHTCKHAVISWLAERDWPVEKIADFTDTSEKIVRRIYRKVNPRYLEGLRDALGTIVFGPAKPTETAVSGPAGGAVPGVTDNTVGINPGPAELANPLKRNGASDGIRTRDPLDHNQRKVRPGG
jgi:integrase